MEEEMICDDYSEQRTYGAYKGALKAHLLFYGSAEDDNERCLLYVPWSTDTIIYECNEVSYTYI